LEHPKGVRQIQTSDQTIKRDDYALLRLLWQNMGEDDLRAVLEPALYIFGTQKRYVHYIHSSFDNQDGEFDKQGWSKKLKEKAGVCSPCKD
jgi:hypothetical protein